MKKFQLIATVLILLTGSPVLHGQFLKKLVKKAGDAAERTILNRAEEETANTVDAAIDTVAGVGSTGASPQGRQDASRNVPTASDGRYNTAKSVNTEAKRSFFTHDVIVYTENEKGETTHSYFDAGELAMKTVASKNDSEMYTDSEGFLYGYNESKQRWEKTGLMRSDAMSFMLPAMSMSLLKLPVEPTMEATEKLRDMGLNMNTFMLVEWAFIYRPDDFREPGFDETTAGCAAGGSCPKFLYEDPEYAGSYVTFDSTGRLSEIKAVTNGQAGTENGVFRFTYDEPVSVWIPDAVEVKQPFQDFFTKGLDVDD